MTVVAGALMGLVVSAHLILDPDTLRNVLKVVAGVLFFAAGTIAVRSGVEIVVRLWRGEP
jgi:uncharacterized membrane protein YhiD involved in acid resistance